MQQLMAWVCRPPVGEWGVCRSAGDLGTALAFVLVVLVFVAIMVVAARNEAGRDWIEARRGSIVVECERVGMRFFDGPTWQEMAPCERTYGVADLGDPESQWRYIPARDMARRLRLIDAGRMTPLDLLQHVRRNGRRMNVPAPVYRMGRAR